MIQEAIAALVEERRNLTQEEAAGVMREIMRAGLDEEARDDGPVATEAQFGAFVTALRLKGETADEITGMAQVMREHALAVPLSSTTPLLDTAGTGGSSRKLFNASTAAAFVAAAGGARVAKHGNRAMTSRSGSADLPNQAFPRSSRTVVRGSFSSCDDAERHLVFVPGGGRRVGAASLPRHVTPQIRFPDLTPYE